MHRSISPQGRVATLVRKLARRRAKSERLGNRLPQFESLETRQLFAAQVLAEWRFNDPPTSTTAADSSGNNHPLTLSGLSSADRVAPPSNLQGNTHALKFGSSNKMATASNVSTQSAESIAFWVKPDSAISSSAGTAVVAELGGVTGDNLSGTIVALGPWTPSLTNESITLVNQDTFQMTAVANVTLPAAQWSHLAFVWNATANRYDTFVNGEMQSVVSPEAGHVGKVSVANNVMIGRRSHTNPAPFAGAIDEFKLYGGPLTTDEIRDVSMPFDAKALLDDANFSGGASYTTTGISELGAGDEYVPVDLNRSYTLSGWARSGNEDGTEYSAANIQYFGFKSFDVNYNEILPQHVQKFPGATDTTLAADLVPGAMEIRLTSAAGWSNSGSGYNRVFAWYGTHPQFEGAFKDYGYTRNLLDLGSQGAWDVGAISNNTIQLRSPWSGPLLRAGAAVRNAANLDGTYNYAALNAASIPNKWTQYSATISGQLPPESGDENKFRPGTAYIKPLILANYHGQTGNRVTWRDVEWSHTEQQTAYGGENVELHVNGIVPPGTGVTYQWTQTAGPTVSLTNANAATAEFVAPHKFTDYDLGFTVTVGGTVTSRTDTVTVHVPAAANYTAGFDTSALLETATWSGNETYTKVGTAGSFTVFGDDFVRVDTTESYRLSGTARSGNDDGSAFNTNNKQFFGFASYDIDRQRIDPQYVLKYSPTADTRLARPLKKNDTVVYLENASGWSSEATASTRIFAWYGYTDSTGYQYPDYSYTRNVVGDVTNGAWSSIVLSENKLILKSAWSGPDLDAGTAVSNTKYGSTYNYAGLSLVKVPNAWTTYEATISGVGSGVTQFRPGTAYIKTLFLTNQTSPNQAGGEGNRITWRDVQFRYARPWQNRGNPFDVNADGSVTSADINAANNRLGGIAEVLLATPATGNSPPPFYDVNGDGKLTLADITLVQAAVSGSTSELSRHFSAGDRVELHRKLPAFPGSATYAWQQISGPPVVISNAQSRTASFVAPNLEATTSFTFRLTLSDGTSTFTDEVTTVVDKTPIDVRYSVETLDLQGNAITSLAVGEQFLLKVFVEDRRPTGLGPFAGHLDVRYDAAKLDLISGLTFGTAFDTADAANTLTDGLIDEAGANSSSISPSGLGKKLLFETVLEATAAGTVILETDPADLSTYHPTLVYGQSTSVSSKRITYGTTRLEILQSTQQSFSVPESEFVSDEGIADVESGDSPELHSVSGDPMDSDVTQLAMPVFYTDEFGTLILTWDFGEQDSIEFDEGEPPTNEQPITTIWGPEVAIDEAFTNSATASMSTSCDAVIDVNPERSPIREGESVGVTVTATWTSSACPEQLDIVINLSPIAFADQFSIKEGDTPKEIKLKNGESYQFTVNSVVDPDNIDETLRVEAHSTLSGVTGDEPGITVDDDGVDHTGTLTAEQGPDNRCSCSCTVCIAPGLAVDVAFGVAQYILQFPISFMPVVRTEGANGTNPQLRASHIFPVGGTLPKDVEVQLSAKPENGDAPKSLGEPIKYGVSDSKFIPGDRFDFAVQANLNHTALPETGEYIFYNIQLDATPLNSSGASESSMQPWRETVPYLARNLAESYIAPGWSFPFLNRLVLNRTSIDSFGAPHAGVGIIRGDNTASWYQQDGSSWKTPAESVSDLSAVGNQFKLQHPDGEYDLFDSTGMHIQSIDRNGNATTYSYDGQQRLILVTDPYGRKTEYTYSAQPNEPLLTIKDFANRLTEFTKNVNGSLNVTYRPIDNNTPIKELKFEYDDKLRLTKIVDEPNAVNFQATSINYSPRGRIDWIQRPDNSTFDIVTRMWEEGTLAVPTSGGKLLVSDSAPTGLRKQFTNHGEVKFGDNESTSYIFDLRGRELQTTNPLGQTYKFERYVMVDSLGSYIRDVGEVISTTTPDPDDFSHRSDGIASNGSSTPYIHNFDYDDDANPISQSWNVGTNDTLYQQTWLYDDPIRLLTESTNELGHQVIYTRDDKGNVIKLLELDPTLAGNGTSVWQNPTNKFDVNDDDLVTAIDVLQIINKLNLTGAQPTTELTGSPPNFYDTNGDKQITAIDALIVINRINEVGIDLVTQESASSFAYTDGDNELNDDALPRGLVERVTENTGRSDVPGIITSYSYYPMTESLGTRGRVESVTEAGVVTRFTYDLAGNVASVKDTFGNETKYRYDSLDRLLAEIGPDPDEDGKAPVVRYQYDAFGNVIAVERLNFDPAKTTTTVHTICLAYDQMNRLKGVQEGGYDIAQPTAQNPDDPTFRYALTSEITCASGAAETIYTYDDRGNVLTMEDAENRVTDYKYDAADQLIRITEPSPDGQTANRPVTNFTYDNIGRVWSTTDPLGGEAHYRYDEFGRTIAEFQVRGSDLTNSQREDLYFANIERLKVIRRDKLIPEVAIKTYDYSVRTSNDVKLGWNQKITDPLGRESVIELDYLGQTSNTIDPLGRSMRSEYFADGLIKALSDDGGNGDIRRTTYEYNALGLLKSVTAPDPDANGPLLSPTTSYLYDAAGRLTSVVNPLSHVTSYAYDALNRVTTVTEPDPDGTDDKLPAKTTYEYDSFANYVREMDAFEHSTTYEYDHLFRPIKSTDALGKSTIYTYDKVGNLKSLKDPENNVTAWDYDRLNRVASETQVEHDPTKNRSRFYKYDLVGNVVEKVDREGRVTKYGYDDFYRLTSEKWFADSSDTIADHEITFGYDLAGQLNTAFDSAAALTFTYDALGRVNLTQQTLPGLAAVILDNDYDLFGNRKKLAANIGGTINSELISNGTSDFVTTFSYDRLNRMTSVTQNGVSGGNAVSAKHVTFAYDAAGQMKTVSRYSDVQATSHVASSIYSYDSAGRLTGLNHQQSSLGTDPELVVNIARYSWEFDKANRITKHTDYEQLNETADYAYDSTDQLTNAGRLGDSNDESFEYDSNGNRTNNGFDTETHNRLTTDGTFTYLYDKEGNRTKRTNIDPSSMDYGSTTEYAWDHRNRLTSVVDKDSIGNVTMDVDYAYDAFDRRVSKTVDRDGIGFAWPESDFFIYDGEQIALQFHDSNASPGSSFPPSLTHRYLYGDVVDMILADEQISTGSSSGPVFWPLGDHLNSVRDMIDSNGLVRRHISYDAFGNRLSESAFDSNGATIPTTQPAAIDTLFGYTGREWDRDIELQYNRARWYDPTVGRWISEDPIQFAGGDKNLSRYVENKSSISVDPDGLESRDYWQKRARELAKYDANLSAEDLNIRITAAYAETFLRDPKRFLWAGMAALASNSVGDALFRARCLGTAYEHNPFGGIIVTFSFDPWELHRALATGNRAVFNDVYWQFIAYSERGIEEMRELHRRGELPLRLLEGWEAIDKGEFEAGNKILLRYEQEVTLQQGVYDKFSKKLFSFTMFMESPVPGDTTSAWDAGCSSVADFRQRWSWIEKSMLPAYLELHHGNLQRLQDLLNIFIRRANALR